MSDDNTKWCQNPRCPEKKNSNQIRGTKGKKFYQSNATGRYSYGNGNFCTLRCYNEWSNQYLDRAIDNLGIRIVDPIKLPMESAWSKGYHWEYNNDNHIYQHYIQNKLMGIKIPITEHQYNSISYNNDECLALANQIGYKQSA